MGKKCTAGSANIKNYLTIQLGQNGFWVWGEGGGGREARLFFFLFFLFASSFLDRQPAQVTRVGKGRGRD